jgi:hypothetical protein
LERGEIYTNDNIKMDLIEIGSEDMEKISIF